MPDITYIHNDVEYEWNDEKYQSNQHKHRISFEDAVRVWDGVHFTSPDPRDHLGEERSIVVGSIDGVVVLVVVYTDRAERRRIISARRASNSEQRDYWDAYRQSQQY